MFNFGSGFLFGVPNAQQLATNPTPQYFGTVQEVGVEISATIKELRGNLQFPDDEAVGDKKISGKITFGRIEIDNFNQLYFADAITTGIKAINPFFAAQIPATPFQVTITPPGGGTYGVDLGVRDATTGFPFTKVAAAPATNQYTQVAALYTFAAADTLRNVQISYTYTLATGRTMTVNNQFQGYGPQFEMWLSDPYAGTGNGMHLFAVKAAKLNAPRKRSDYTIVEIDFEGFANAAGQVFEWFQISP